MNKRVGQIVEGVRKAVDVPSVTIDSGGGVVSVWRRVNLWWVMGAAAVAIGGFFLYKFLTKKPKQAQAPPPTRPQQDHAQRNGIMRQPQRQTMDEVMRDMYAARDAEVEARKQRTKKAEQEQFVADNGESVINTNEMSALAAQPEDRIGNIFDRQLAILEEAKNANLKK